MINDSVREELATKITQLKASQTPKIRTRKRGTELVENRAKQFKLKPSPKSIETQPKTTAELTVRKDTSPTLVEFQTEKTELPEWRLQMQNAVRQRMEQKEGTTYTPSQGGQGVAVALARNPVTSPRRSSSNLEGVRNSNHGNNDHLTKALNRIKTSRKKYLISEKVSTDEIPERKDTKFPFTIASRTENPQTDLESRKTSVNFPSAPTLIPTKAKSIKGVYDTNELNPEFAKTKASSSFGNKPVEADPANETETPPKNQPVEEVVGDIEEIDDFAPFSLRFNSGLFDLIIGIFVSLVVLSPFMLFGGNWFTLAGFLGFFAVCAVVMFIYLTTTIGYFGKTFGMHLFKLEVIDIEGEEYPTFHQAAVSSAVYLLSISFGGVGFLTSLLDEENRAAHDLASGTIIVKEF